MGKSGAQLQMEIEGFLSAAPKAATAAASSTPGVDRALQDRIDAYEAKLDRKRERLERGAAKAAAESSARLGAARRIGDAIPFGQPILVGHHSEKRHRRDIAKIDNNMRKGFEASDRAKDLAGRAAAVGTGGISSDDPIAVQKLKAELAPLVKMQGQMKAANAAIRKHAKAGPAVQIAALVGLGYGEKIATKLLEKDFAGRIGFADYQITNNGANIRRIEKRIAELGAKATTPARTPISGTTPDGMSFTIAENPDVNRTQITFPGKPSDRVRAALKSGGFRWAPSEGVWQRQMSNGAWHAATRAVGAI